MSGETLTYGGFGRLILTHGFIKIVDKSLPLSARM